MKLKSRCLNPYLLYLELATELVVLALVSNPAHSATVEPSLQYQNTPAIAQPIAPLNQANLSEPSFSPKLKGVEGIHSTASATLISDSTSAESTDSKPDKAAPAEVSAPPTPLAPIPSTHSIPTAGDQLVESTKSNSSPDTSTVSPARTIPEKPTSLENPSTVSTPILNQQIRILTPTAESLFDIPAATVVVQYPQNQRIELKVNGVVVPATLVGRTETDSTAQLITQTFYGVALKAGRNILTAQALATDPTTAIASEAMIATIEVQVRGQFKQIKVETVESRIPADGRSIATIRGQLLDEQGNRSNRDATVTLATSAGEFVEVDANPDQPGFQVKAQNGQFSAKLRAGLETKMVNIQATVDSLEAFTQIQFETALRPFIGTGVVDIRLGKRGTNFFGSYRDFLPPDRQNDLQLDVRAAGFASGQVGDWLVTGAFNSDRPLNQSCDGTNPLFRASQPCDQSYPTYGDNSQSTVVTPSTDNLYLRIERNSPVLGAGTDYAMWGDYNTEEFATKSQQFTATTRQLHGLKLNYNLGNLQATGFYGNNVKGFQRDTIAPDGTSGYYFLSRRLLLEGSEDVFVELEELNRPGTVIDRKKLSRGPDYEIDYDRGTLLFRQPVLRTDLGEAGETLVRRIVITYQYDTPGQDNRIYAGRVRYHLARELNRESWLGATYLQENQGDRNFELYGADAYISLGSNAHLIAEYAHSKNEADGLGSVSGAAYRAELAGQIAKNINGRAYYRHADTGFANNATLSFVPGQTRYGAQVAARVSPTTNLRVQYDHEDNKGIAPRPLNALDDLLNPRTNALPGSRVDNSLTTISAGIQQKLGNADLTVDWLHRDREDRINQDNTTSDQLRSRLTLPLSKNLTLLAQNETSFSSERDPIYPDRTLLGLNWAAMPGVNVQLAQQFFSSGQDAGKSITSLNVTGDYKLGPDTTIFGRYAIALGNDGLINQGAVGIKQGITLAPGLKVDLAYEHVFGSFFGSTGAGSRFAQPFAPGQSAASLGVQGGDSYSIGFSYTGSPNFQANARFEHRTSSEGSNTVISAAATGKLSPSLTALFRYQQASAANQKLVGLGDTANLKLGLAYRDPNSDKFNALLRYEYRKNPSTIPDTLLLGSGTGSREHLFAVEAIYAPNWRWELYGKFALRNSTTYLAKDLVASGTTYLAQARAIYRLGYRWDVSGEVRWLSQPNAGFTEIGLVAELGYYLTPGLRLAAGYSFGGIQDDDFEGTRSAGGPYLGVSLKLDELFSGFGLQRKRPQPKSTPIKAAEVVTPSENTVKPDQPAIATTSQAEQPLPASPATALPFVNSAQSSSPAIAKPGDAATSAALLQ